MSDAAAWQTGADRFTGFADLYDGVRPFPPGRLGELFTTYLGRRPERVVDLGCGTGLSSRWASGWADEVVGVEPSTDMREAAIASGGTHVSYRAGWSHETGLPAASADVVLAVQALHWMEPEPTFREIARLLRPGGLFAAIDCDWPPVVGDSAAEAAWDSVRRHIRVFEARLAAGETGAILARPVDPGEVEGGDYSGADPNRRRTLPENVRSWSKGEHLERMAGSGVFDWCREIALTSTERGNADRFLGLLRSQGDYQTLRRHGLDDDTLGVTSFADVVRERLGDVSQQWEFVYRARLGFKLAERPSRRLDDDGREK